jgi:hypothetical protein
MTGSIIPDWLADCGQFLPVPRDERSLRVKNWQEIRLSPDELHQHLGAGGNLGFRCGPRSGGYVDCDLDSDEAVALAPLYLPDGAAIYGRPTRPSSHRIYKSPRATYAAFSDPLTGEMIVELRSDGATGGAHMTLLPPSRTDGEYREWEDSREPVTIDSGALGRRVSWLAIGCLTMRHVSEYAAHRPEQDLPDVLWEFDRPLGRVAYHWLGGLAPDENSPREVKHRRDYTDTEVQLEEIVAAIPNNCGWDEWNRLGMAIYAASGGSSVGFAAFDDFSSKSSRYDPRAVRERWNNYSKSQPDRIGIGTLVFLARKAGWQPKRRAA